MQRISPGGMLHVVHTHSVNRRVQQLDLRAAIPLASLSHYYFPANNRAATMSTWCFVRANERGHECARQKGDQDESAADSPAADVNLICRPPPDRKV